MYSSHAGFGNCRMAAWRPHWQHSVATRRDTIMQSSTPTARKPIALVLGANGRFGAAAVQAFASAGWAVLAQARRKPDALPAGATHVAVDMDDAAALAVAAAGARVVVYAVNQPYTQ